MTRPGFDNPMFIGNQISPREFSKDWFDFIFEIWYTENFNLLYW